ncbi:hypothetical protein ACR1PO_02400 [Chryseobacterium sp. RRHN12]|uniref:hypothetical protein n=1 Tax=Chryseobacterium sp. RRHN12 TaxID=3437884 RepID=UPI003D9BA8E8
MKKIIVIAGILAAQLSFAQLYTPSGAVNQTTTAASTNVGVGVNDPHSNFEVGNQNGGKITISTAGWSGTSASPKYPTLESAGYLNSPKVRMTATEETGNIYGSKFSILLNDNTNAANMAERFSILYNGNVGLGSPQPREKLDVLGNIVAGATDSALGINAFAIRYVKGSLNNWGALRSSSSSYMSFGVKANGANVGWLSSSGEASLAKTAITVGNEGFSFLTASSQQVAIDSPVTLNEIMRININGNTSLQGKFEAKEVKVTLTPTADFVFEENYDLPNLEAVAKHIKEKKHLPEIASARVMEKEGVNVGEFQIKLLQKIEELTLYAIKQERQLKDQQEKIQKLEGENSELKNAVSEIKQLKEQFLMMKSNTTR